jgi:acetyltransferase-like isoleucine patch superfamily enzyme
MGMGLRYVILQRLAQHVGDNVSIHDAVFLLHVEKLAVGDNVSVHPMCYIDAVGGVRIGDDVSIAHAVSIVSFEHSFGRSDAPIKEQACIPQQIVIGNDVWIGAGARVLAGTTIGDGSVIGAGAVVAQDIPSHCIAVGVPARAVKKRVHLR